MGSSSTSLYDLAHELLLAAAASLGAGAPAAQFVSIAEPPYDGCALLAVHCPTFSIAPSMRAGQAVGGLQPFHQEPAGVFNIVTLVVTILRCVSVPKGGAQISVPTAAKMNAEAAIAYKDAWQIWNGVRTRLKTDELWGACACRDVLMGPVVPLAPGGGGAGSTMTIQVSLDGYTEPGV